MARAAVLAIAGSGARALCGLLNSDDEVVRGAGDPADPAAAPDHPQR
ncbi:hypothetical protein [Nocardia sp. NPDC004711]